MSTVTCPRVIGATDDGTGLRTCGATMPCAEHSRPCEHAGEVGA